MDSKQYSFSELSMKQVVNIADGRQLGHICDIIFTSFGKIISIIVPGKRGFFKGLTSQEAVVIPWRNICKVGTDVILVEIVSGVGILTENETNQPNNGSYD